MIAPLEVSTTRTVRACDGGCPTAGRTQVVRVRGDRRLLLSRRGSLHLATAPWVTLGVGALLAAFAAYAPTAGAQVVRPSGSPSATFCAEAWPTLLYRSATPGKPGNGCRRSATKSERPGWSGNGPSLK